ncbi:class C sortase [Arthrobacter stackebrandtii]|nr:class C sortase [Arthrobacter stackebrandtii]PYG99909.1 class C sortase [Arthrobacter stackebrandtii]
MSIFLQPGPGPDSVWEPEPEQTPSPRRRSSAALRGFNALLVLGALAGGIVFSYPLAAPWIADSIQADAVVKYEQQNSEIDPQARQRLLAAAHEYNSHLPSGPLRDPYVINERGEAVNMEEGREQYQQQLAINPDDPAAPMARLVVPGLGLDLPVYHGTDEETLTRGVGHFYGSGLPVGGAGNHAVLSAHSGYVNSTLFNDLPSMKLGDTFTLTVLGEVLTYKVDNIATVLPNESELLRQVPGKDYVTLLTCTPRYVNTHRLLVRGERIQTEDAEAKVAQSQLVSAPDPGLPWWVLIALGPATLTLLLLIRPAPHPLGGMRHIQRNG